MTEQTNCTNCQYLVPLGARWCSNCGASLAPQSSSQTSLLGSPPVEATSSSPASSSPASSQAATSQAAPIAAPSPASAAVCVGHPTVQATQKCQACGAAVCSMCDFVIPKPDTGNILGISSNMHLCPNCMTGQSRGQLRPAALASPVLPLPGGVTCSYHLEVAAVRRCAICTRAICQTCDFQLPGHFHVCPDCATKPQQEMSSKRKRNLIISYVLAVWSTLGLAVLFSGALAGMVDSKSALEALGVAINLFILAPAIIGTALSLGCYDRKLSNPPAIWVAAGWNGLIVAGLLLMTILGLAS